MIIVNFDNVRNVIAETLGCDVEAVTLEAKLQEDLGADSLAAKVMVSALTRLEAIKRMRRCLEEFMLEGVPTNAELSYQILYYPAFIRGACTTAFLEECLPELVDFNRRVH